MLNSSAFFRVCSGFFRGACVSKRVIFFQKCFEFSADRWELIPAENLDVGRERQLLNLIVCGIKEESQWGPSTSRSRKFSGTDCAVLYNSGSHDTALRIKPALYNYSFSGFIFLTLEFTKVR